MTGVRTRRQVLTGAQLALLVAGFFVNIGTFAVYPYLAVLLRERLDVGIGTVGVVLGAATLVQFASAPVTAALAERVGLKRALLLATVLYGLGAVAYLLGGPYGPGLTVLGLFLSCGAGAVYSPAYRGYLAQSAAEEHRPLVVSASNSASNLGVALGPVVGAFFLADPGRLFAVNAVLYAVLVVAHTFLRPEHPAEEPAAVEPFRRVLHGLAGLPFVLTALTHYLYWQFYQYLSVYADGRIATTLYGVLMMGYSLGLVVVQPLVSGWVGRIRYPVAMAAGFAAMGAGMVAIAAGGPVTIAVGVAAMSLSTAVLFLKNDLEALARSRRSATVTFGQQRLATGIGAFLSGVVGGNVYALFEHGDLVPGFWLVVAAQAVLLALVAAVRVRASRTP